MALVVKKELWNLYQTQNSHQWPPSWTQENREGTFELYPWRRRTGTGSRSTSTPADQETRGL